MKLSNYYVDYLNNGEPRKVNVRFSKKSIDVIVEEGELNWHDTCLLSVLTAVYVSSHLRGIIPDMNSVKNMGLRLYQALVDGNYKELKAIEEMSDDEFNNYLKDHGI